MKEKYRELLLDLLHAANCGCYLSPGDELAVRALEALQEILNVNHGINVIDEIRVDSNSKLIREHKKGNFKHEVNKEMCENIMKEIAMDKEVRRIKEEQENMNLKTNNMEYKKEIKSEIIKKLHDDATEMEKEGICLMVKGAIDKAYGKFEFSQSLRIAANYLDGVDGGSGE
jgi:hypothetical protein